MCVYNERVGIIPVIPSHRGPQHLDTSARRSLVWLWHGPLCGCLHQAAYLRRCGSAGVPRGHCSLLRELHALPRLRRSRARRRLAARRPLRHSLRNLGVFGIFRGLLLRLPARRSVGVRSFRYCCRRAVPSTSLEHARIRHERPNGTSLLTHGFGRTRCRAGTSLLALAQTRATR